jgi:mono/diheme cytochrome c family protein
MTSKGKQSSEPGTRMSFQSEGRELPGRVAQESRDEPKANRAAVPVFFLVALVAVLFWGDMYLVDHGGELDARVYAPYRSVEELTSYLPKGEGDLLKAQGQKVYKLYCSACHQDDGNGNPSGFIPPLAGSDWVAAKDPSRIIRIVLNGLQGPITVSGKQFGQTAMLPWRDALNDQDVAGVLTYVRSSWGNKSIAVNAEEVKKIRDETKSHGGSFSPDELLQIPLKE